MECILYPNQNILDKNSNQNSLFMESDDFCAKHFETIQLCLPRDSIMNGKSHFSVGILLLAKKLDDSLFTIA